MFNKWKKCILGTKTGKDLFEKLEKNKKTVNIYNEEHKVWWQAIAEEGKSSSCDQSLILAICTPLMSRVHEHVMFRLVNLYMLIQPPLLMTSTILCLCCQHLQQQVEYH